MIIRVLQLTNPKVFSLIQFGIIRDKEIRFQRTTKHLDELWLEQFKRNWKYDDLVSVSKFVYYKHSSFFYFLLCYHKYGLAKATYKFLRFADLNYDYSRYTITFNIKLSVISNMANQSFIFDVSAALKKYEPLIWQDRHAPVPDYYDLKDAYPVFDFSKWKDAYSFVIQKDPLYVKLIKYSRVIKDFRKGKISRIPKLTYGGLNDYY